MTFSEDARLVRVGATPQALAGLRIVVPTLSRGAGWTNIAATLSHFA
ncbi:MAG TPA: hypothetical protein VFU81_06185 [Thermomicrobiales bacterium]|nr:hypothetical protein [Thermomicrobiales bacterium]